MKRLVLVLAATGCLDPLVEDGAGSSTHLLPAGTAVPDAVTNADLAAQIALNDGIDDRTLAMLGRIPRGRGLSNGEEVRFWSFGPATRAPSPLYELYDADGTTRLDHPAFVDALPGDAGYSPVHVPTKVRVTAKYQGELITTVAALADAIDLGLVEEPQPTATFVATPIVLLGTKLEVGPGDATADPEVVYAGGYEVGTFRFGGARGVQPLLFLLPTAQVSFLRSHDGASYDTTRPIFQAQIPAQPPAMMTTYTPLSVVVNVDLDGNASAVTRDSDLYDRVMGVITVTHGISHFEVTAAVQLLPLQFTEGEP